MRAATVYGWHVPSRHVYLNFHLEMYDILHDKTFYTAFEEVRKKGFKDAKVWPVVCACF